MVELYPNERPESNDSPDHEPPDLHNLTERNLSRQCSHTTQYNGFQPEGAAFQAHPPTLFQVPVSPTAPLSNTVGSAPLDPYSPHPTISNGLDPTRLPHQAFSHAHDISFHPPPSVSSDDPSSPTYSSYQGYTYGKEPFVASPHLYRPHFPNFYQTPAGSNDAVPFPIVGNQLPLTPSATPLESIPQQWVWPVGDPTKSRSATVEHAFTRPITPGRPSARHHSRCPNISELYGRRKLYLQQNTVVFHECTISPSSSLTETRLLQHFNEELFADCYFILRHKGGRFGDKRWFLSRLLLSESPILRNIRDSFAWQRDNCRYKQHMELSITDRFIRPASIDCALRVLYGMQPDCFVNIAECMRLHPDMSREDFVHALMKETLGFIASGCLFLIRRIILYGLRLAVTILEWGSLEQALSFALEAESGRERNASASVVPTESTLELCDIECQHVSAPNDGTKSSNELSDQLSNHSFAPEDEWPRCATDLLSYCLHFIARELPNAWKLDTKAQPLQDVDRLPITRESKSSHPTSHLSRIQFGDHPSEATTKSGDHHLLLSTIVLSLPFEWLEYLFTEAPSFFGPQIPDVIEERERRRAIILSSGSVSLEEREAARDHAWAEAGWEESTQMGADGKLGITRKYTGLALREVQDRDEKWQFGVK